MNVLGVSAHYHDSAACLISDGEIVAAVQEEAFSRKKHDARLPWRSIEYCLQEANLTWGDLDWIGYYERPDLKLQRILAAHVATGRRDETTFDTVMDRWTKERLDFASYFPSSSGSSTRVVAIEHHVSHAASAFFPSPFEEAAVLTIDGVGEYTTTSIAHGRGNKLEMLAGVSFPHSLGLFYSACTAYAGFKVNSGEYKLMGLAPYGNPTFVDLIEQHFLKLGPDGSFKLNVEHFGFVDTKSMLRPSFAQLIGAPPRRPEEPIRTVDVDLARSAQVVLERAVLGLARRARDLTGSPRLCLAGGVALNCVANSHLLCEGPFDDVWVQPAAGDAGGAVGVASFVHHHHLDQPRVTSALRPGADNMRGAYLGPSYSDEAIRRYLLAVNASFSIRENDDDLAANVAELLASGHIIGWFQGRMEFGPRALGNRSILADPRDPDMQRRLNAQIKEREGFRPFAPAVAAEDAPEYFDMARPTSPYMLFTAPVTHRLRHELTPQQLSLRGMDKLSAVRSVIPAVTHVDFSARVQTVHAETNPLFSKLLRAFKGKTGCAVLVNTSFNVRGEPIVCSPADAFRCFMRTSMDYLVIGHQILARADQNNARTPDYEVFDAD